MKKGILIILLLCLSILMVKGQTLNDAYNEFKQKVTKDYEDFRKKANKEYAAWMKKAWEWHDKIEPVEKPKDDMKPPVIYEKEKQEEQKEEPKPLPHEEIAPVPEPEPQPKPIAPIREYEGDFKYIEFQFFGTNAKVRIPTNKTFKLQGKSESTMASAWETLSSNEYDNLIRDCLGIRISHQLCDWAYLQMLGEMSEAICGKSTNEAVMLQGFVFCQSGYKARLGMTKDQRLHLLFKSDHLVFNLVGFKMDDGIYYLTKPISEEGLYICDIPYPEERPLSLWISQEQFFSERQSGQRFFSPSDNSVNIQVQINENLIKFYDTYPTSMVGEDILSRWAMYANTPLSKKVKDQLYPQLKSVISKTENKVAAADWLLYWVQTAFKYEYDDKVWGNDRAFFAEETLYYPYCDCEDRSILYSRLVRDLLGLNVLLVFYPGHLATAVEFNAPVKGDYINLNGRHFTICDPTYIDAPVGATMPDMDNQSAKVILLSK